MTKIARRAVLAGALAAPLGAPMLARNVLAQVGYPNKQIRMRAELQQMAQQQGSGSIVNTASLAGLTGFVSTAAYAASKHGVVGLTKTAAIEYAPKVRVNCVCPGWINTDMRRAAGWIAHRSGGRRSRRRRLRLRPSSRRTFY